MKRIRLVIGIVLVVSSLLFTSCMSTQDVVRTIEVSASASVKLTPDIASFSIEVSELGKTTSEAQQLANEKMAQLLSVLRTHNVAEKDIKTTMVSLRPSYDWIDGKQILNGQVASQSLTVTYRNLSDLGSVIDQMGQVSGIYLNSVNLDKEDKREALEQARAQAVQNARDKASLYAREAGMVVAEPITISEYSTASNPYSPRPKMALANDAAYVMATEIPTGSMEVTSSVSMVFQMYGKSR
ncbi:MAG: SIMPL domain-containing protein [Sphaerochaeta sp.]|uniref:SIMPL domain-containing protein n=1 Tax=Sphaerochaeta sp. TaxID=1972642 RepID=UPI003D0FDC7E